MSTTQEPDCGSSSCIFSAKGGMRTNGPCRCYENAGFHGSAVMAARQMLPELLKLRAAHAWIDASERLPENGAKVLAVVREVIILVYDTDTEFPGAPWRTENADIVFNKSSIVKWMPIPGDT